LFNLGRTSTLVSELTGCVDTSLALETRSPSSPARQAPETGSPSSVTPPLTASPRTLETDRTSTPTAVRTASSNALEAPSSSSPAAAPVASPIALGTSSASPAAPSPHVSWLPPDAARLSEARSPAELEEIRLARNFLLATGLPNARLLVDTDKPLAFARFNAVWKSDKVAGAVRIVPQSRQATAIAIASELINVDPQLCKGDFASARSSEVVDGSVVFRAVLSCTEGHGERTAQYFITPRRTGGFVVFAVIGNTGGDGDVASDGQPIDIFKRAVVQATGSGD